jgi:hypothetical protein
MSINPNIPKTVNPGEPVTAQAWNVIVGGIVAITNYLDSTQASVLKIAIANAGFSMDTARVTAVRDDGVAFQAVGPVAPDTNFVIAGLRPGSYTVHAEAPGFDAKTAPVTVPSDNVVSLTLTPHGAFAPALFGTALQTALQQLKNSNIAVSRILDVAGRDVAPANPSSDYTSSPVLAQIPAAGDPVAPDGSMQLVVAASLQVQASIEMPPLAGLTLAEAQKALEGIGLVLGKVVTKQTATPPAA